MSWLTNVTIDFYKLELIEEIVVVWKGQWLSCWVDWCCFESIDKDLVNWMNFHSIGEEIVITNKFLNFVF